MGMKNVEEEYMDVLQNIEFGIVSVYRQHDDLVDYDVEHALNSLIRKYRADQTGKSFDPPVFTPLVQKVYESTKTMCEWRLGRESPVVGKTSPFEHLEPVSLDEMIACLKRVRKSVQRWHKQGGRQGYLQFIEGYVK
jgi:hypothetical protein